MASERVCENCWQFEEPRYAAHPGVCGLGVYEEPYSNTKACHAFEGRDADEFDPFEEVSK